MLQTAAPATVERVHEEAFATFTPAQRRRLLKGLRASLPAYERALATVPYAQEPRSLARLTLRAEHRQPRIMQRVLTSSGSGEDGLLASFAAGFIESKTAQSFFSNIGDIGFGDGR